MLLFVTCGQKKTAAQVRMITAAGAGRLEQFPADLTKVLSDLCALSLRLTSSRPQYKPATLNFLENLLRRNERNLLAKDFLKRSKLYQELKAEHDEILRHKWIESEKLGRDVGYDAAMIGWKLKHHAGWRRGRQGAHGSLSYQI